MSLDVEPGAVSLDVEVGYNVEVGHYPTIVPALYFFKFAARLRKWLQGCHCEALAPPVHTMLRNNRDS